MLHVSYHNLGLTHVRSPKDSVTGTVNDRMVTILLEELKQSTEG